LKGYAANIIAAAARGVAEGNQFVIFKNSLLPKDASSAQINDNYIQQKSNKVMRETTQGWQSEVSGMMPPLHGKSSWICHF
jgi:hypothetical protein